MRSGLGCDIGTFPDERTHLYLSRRDRQSFQDFQFDVKMLFKISKSLIKIGIAEGFFVLR
jgi:hypothetical protein